MESITTDLISAAANFVNSTSSHIFLTGKAGTGKTTFLKNLALQTYKNFVIVAPTGIAALNAGGVTIHSQFQLPLGTFLPDRTPAGHFNDQSNVYTQFTLSRKHPLSGTRRQVLRSIDLLIIDEVSMLRADVLDAIDYRLRSVRGNFRQSFGGVQVLMIGDLYQLPPIVKDHEWSYLKRYYHSAHFFESKALQDAGIVYIELDKIFRQQDHRFIDLLNNLRNNQITADDIEVLNRHYNPAVEEGRDVITLTTHNYKAIEINRRALAALSGQLFRYQADISDDFPESIFPMDQNLELKIGARVMFVKNDSSGAGKYFNGKLAEVTILDGADVYVRMEGESENFRLVREQWENKRYTVNDATKELDEEVIGTFSQFPVKLAWAVTVHKSQGLTFDKAIIDVGHAFAPGQVYVALSRLRSLDGLILKTKIDTGAISSDQLVVNFSESQHMQGDLLNLLKEKQRMYLSDLITSTYDFSFLIKSAVMLDHENRGGEFDNDSMRSAVSLLLRDLEAEVSNTRKFSQQLITLLGSGDNSELLTRAAAGANYYNELLKKHIRGILIFSREMSIVSGNKSFLKELAELDQMLMKKWDEVTKSSGIIATVLGGGDFAIVKDLSKDMLRLRESWISEAQQISPSASSSGVKKLRKKGKGVKKAAAKKLDTVSVSLELFRKGYTPEQIAAERSLTLGTVEQHLAKSVTAGNLELEKLVGTAGQDEISKALNSNQDKGLKDLYEILGGKYSYAKIRTVREVLLGEKAG